MDLYGIMALCSYKNALLISNLPYLNRKEPIECSNSKVQLYSNLEDGSPYQLARIDLYSMCKNENLPVGF